MMSKLKIKTIEEFFNEGISPEILFWVGCAGSFDDRAKKITKAFIKILTKYFKNIFKKYFLNSLFE